MAYLMENIGNIFIGFGALYVLTNWIGAGGNSDDADDGWVHSSDNPCSPNYQD